MRRGTTPTITIKLEGSEEESEITKAILTIKQRDSIVNRNVEVEDKQIVCRLTQEETLKFNPYEFADVQVKLLMENGTVLATDIKRVMIEAILNEEKIE